MLLIIGLLLLIPGYLGNQGGKRIIDILNNYDMIDKIEITLKNDTFSIDEVNKVNYLKEFFGESASYGFPASQYKKYQNKHISTISFYINSEIPFSVKIFTVKKNQDAKFQNVKYVALAGKYYSKVPDNFIEEIKLFLDLWKKDG